MSAGSACASIGESNGIRRCCAGHATQRERSSSLDVELEQLRAIVHEKTAQLADADTQMDSLKTKIDEKLEDMAAMKQELEGVRHASESRRHQPRDAWPALWAIACLCCGQMRRLASWHLECA